MVVQEPGVVDQAFEDQRLAAGHGAALAAHDRTGREMGARCLVGAAGELRTYPLPAVPGGETAARGLPAGANRRPDSLPRGLGSSGR
jgi:hypothetical protein